MINFLIGNIKTVGIAIIAFIAVYILRKNKTLTSENQELKDNKLQQDKIINIQTKVLDVSKNVKPTDLDVNLERLSDKTK
jgi:hypothetical protein